MRIAVAGTSGRMGQMLIGAVAAADDLTLSGAFDQPGAALLGQDAGSLLGCHTGVAVSDDLSALVNADTATDVLIDFTRPDGTLAHLRACVAAGVNLVIGTTGFDAAGRRAIAEAAERIAIVYAPNMSVGVNATLKLLAAAARLLGEDYDVEILDAHHRNKIDAPSGTALAMGEAVAAARGLSLDALATWSRHGDTGVRPRGAIGFAAVRGGDLVGEHTVYFCGAGERIEITHRATSRETYAQGALRAARFLKGRDKGLFDMQAVLGGSL